MVYGRLYGLLCWSTFKHSTDNDRSSQRRKVSLYHANEQMTAQKFRALGEPPNRHKKNSQIKHRHLPKAPAQSFYLVQHNKTNYGLGLLQAKQGCLIS